MVQMLTQQFAKLETEPIDKKTMNVYKKIAAITGENVEDVIKRQLEESRRHLEELRQPNLQRDLRGTESLTRVEFSTDGREIFCATDHGVRVYDWSQVLVARNETPAPVLSAEAEPVFLEGQPHKSRYTYALAYDDADKRLLFGGIDGKVSSLDLQAGQVDVLLDMTTRNTVMHLCLSSDRAALCSVAMPPPTARRKTKERRARVQIWDYRKLTEAFGQRLSA
jgi:WD40 repeat protein